MCGQELPEVLLHDREFNTELPQQLLVQVNSMQFMEQNIKIF